MQPPIVVICKEREEKLGSEVISGFRSDLQKRRKKEGNGTFFPEIKSNTLHSRKKTDKAKVVRVPM